MQFADEPYDKIKEYKLNIRGLKKEDFLQIILYMLFDYEDWLDERLGKPVMQTKSAWSKLLSREISKTDVKECILFGEKRSAIQTPTGVKVTMKKEVVDPRFEALIVVYIETNTHYKIISNHLRRKKRR